MLDRLDLLLKQSQAYSEIIAMRLQRSKEKLKKRKVATNVEPSAPPSKRPQRNTRPTQPNTLPSMFAKLKKTTASEKKSINQLESELFQGVLNDYQLEGVDWLDSLFVNGINGILADEMVCLYFLFFYFFSFKYFERFEFYIK